MAENGAQNLVWIDCEMTGLDIARDKLIEVAVLVTDSELNVLDPGLDIVIHASDDDLNVVAEGPDLVVAAPPGALDRMDDVVRDMHTRSGLLPAIEASTLTLEEAGAQTLAFLREHLEDPGSVPLCGNSIGTDRRFLSAHLPDVENVLNYRSVDVSTIKELVRRWYPAALSGAPRKAGGHRALDDFGDSI